MDLIKILLFVIVLLITVSKAQHKTCNYINSLHKDGSWGYPIDTCFKAGNYASLKFVCTENAQNVSRVVYNRSSCNETEYLYSDIIVSNEVEFECNSTACDIGYLFVYSADPLCAKRDLLYSRPYVLNLCLQLGDGGYAHSYQIATCDNATQTLNVTGYNDSDCTILANRNANSSVYHLADPNANSSLYHVSNGYCDGNSYYEVSCDGTIHSVAPKWPLSQSSTTCGYVQNYNGKTGQWMPIPTYKCYNGDKSDPHKFICNGQNVGAILYEEGSDCDEASVKGFIDLNGDYEVDCSYNVSCGDIGYITMWKTIENSQCEKTNMTRGVQVNSLNVCVESSPNIYSMITCDNETIMFTEYNDSDCTVELQEIHSITNGDCPGDYYEIMCEEATVNSATSSNPTTSNPSTTNPSTSNPTTSNPSTSAPTVVIQSSQPTIMANKAVVYQFVVSVMSIFVSILLYQ
eukprot:79078_1